MELISEYWFAFLIIGIVLFLVRTVWKIFKRVWAKVVATIFSLFFLVRFLMYLQLL